MDFSLENFTGPLDLLLQLIERNQVDIMDIPISEIADQFAAYISAIDADPETLSSFLTLAAVLLDIKCRMLLPKEEQEEDEQESDPRLELVKKLLEYKMYKQMGKQLTLLLASSSRCVYREKSFIKIEMPKEDIDYASLLRGKTVQDLYRTYLFSLSRKRQRKDPVRAGFGNIHKEEVDTERQKRHVCEWMKNNPVTTFSEMTKENRKKEETVVDFLLVLEMAKAGDIELAQEYTFSEISLAKK